MSTVSELELEVPESVEKISVWLQPTDYLAESSEFRRHLATQAPGTGLWLRQTDEYRRWRDSENCGSMWVKGVPGAGKSVVAASMVDLLRTPQRVPVLFFFFRQIVAANHTPRSLTKDWLAQLLPYSLAIQQSLSLCLKEDVEENCSEDQLWQILLDGLSSVPMVYCVADALDEMDSGNEKFLARLNSLAAFRPASVKLLLTSRPKQYLQSALKNAHIVHVSLEKDLVERDIVAFVSHRLHGDNFKSLSEEQKRSLQVTICAKSQGLFLYAKLITDQIEESLKGSQAIDFANLAVGLPIGLEQMYDDVLFKQRETLFIDESIQRFILQCVTHSARPLRLNELASALRFGYDDTKLPSDCKSLIRTACGPLLQILEDETVQVIHHSFTEFLRSNQRSSGKLEGDFPHFKGIKEHKMLLILCLRYLSLSLSEQPFLPVECPERDSELDDDNDSETEDRQSEHQTFPFDYQRACLEHPLLEYAVSNWTYHASKHNIKDQETFDALDKFLEYDRKEFQIWLWLQWGSWKANEPGRDRTYALHVAAFGGLTEYARHLYTTGADVNLRDTDQKTALHWASLKGQANMAALLLEHGADANPADRRGLTPIHEASKRDCSSVVRILLKAGVSLRTPKTKENHGGRLLGGEKSTMGETPLEYACQNGNTDTVCEMLEYMTQGELDEALCLAIKNDRNEIVSVILARANPSPNAMLDGRTATFLASTKTHVDTIRELLARGADLSLLSGDGGFPFRRRIYSGMRNKTPQWTPIHGLMRSSTSYRPSQFRTSLRLLIDAGANLEAQDLNGDTALTMLTRTAMDRPQDVDKLMVLLEHGANVSAVDKQGSCALHQILSSGARPHLVRLLLDHGATAEARKDGRSVLWTTVSTKNYHRDSDREAVNFRECVELLLQHGAVCDFDVLKAAFGNTYCNIAVLEILLTSSNITVHEKGLLLHHIGRGEMRDYAALIELLVKHGADIETRNHRGETPFLSQVSGSIYCWDMVNALLNHGARWDVTDVAGQSALWLCPRNLNTRFADGNWERLVEMGLDPLQPRSDGCNLLHLVALKFDGSAAQIADLERLIDMGLNINHKNCNGSPPLHFKQILGSNIDQIRSTDFLSVLKMSKKQKLDINAQNNRGFTALHLAAARSDSDVARLLNADADASIQTMDGGTALHVACENGRSIVGLLIQHSKAPINLPDHHGRTPLHVACIHGRPASVYYLLKAGASVYLKDKQGDTPLHCCAAFSGKMVWTGMDRENPNAEEILKDIIKPPHLDPDIEEKRAQTFQFCETQLYHESDTSRVTGVVNLLLAHGADPLEKNKSENSPLDLAILWGRQDMAEILLGDRPLADLTSPARVRLKFLRQMNIKFRHPSLQMLEKDLEDNDLFTNASKYSRVLTVADLELMVSRWHKEPEIENGPYSLIRTFADLGLVELMKVVGHICKLYDNADWIERRQDKTRSYTETFKPPLQRACDREICNMVMVQLLVDQYGVDVNAHHQMYPEYGSVEEKELRPGNTALHCLAVGRYWWQIDAIRWLVSRGANLNARNRKGETPLHVASHGWRSAPYNLTKTEGFWSRQCVNLLLELGADPNIIDDDGFTCLNKASKEPGIVLDLLKGGADLDVGSKHPLFSAIVEGSVDVVAILLDHGADVNMSDADTSQANSYDVKEVLRTPLFCAAIPSRYSVSNPKAAQVAQILLKREADWKATLNSRETLVHHVFENALIQVIDVFLAFPKIDYNFRDQAGRTVLHAACNAKECLPGYGHLHWDPKGDLPAIKMLDLGADINATDVNGKNALHHLLDNENLSTDITLLFLQRQECKVLITKKDTAGFSPLQTALGRFRIRACDFLLTNGADLLDKDPHGRTALHYLSSGLAHDREGNRLANHNGYPPQKLHDEPFRFPAHSLDLWHRYLSQGGDINARDNEGNPALFTFLASAQKHEYDVPMDTSCHVDAFPLLFKQDADIFARNNYGETALHIVAKRAPKTKDCASLEMRREHDAKLFRMLVGMGLDPLAEDDKGRSSLDVAAACSNTGILELFRQGRK